VKESIVTERELWGLVPEWVPLEEMRTLEFWLPLIIAAAALLLLLVIVRLIVRSYFAEKLSFERKRFRVFFEEKLRFERKRRETE